MQDLGKLTQHLNEEHRHQEDTAELKHKRGKEDNWRLKPVTPNTYFQVPPFTDIREYLL